MSASVYAATARIQEYLNGFDVKGARRSIDSIREGVDRIVSKSAGKFAILTSAVDAVGVAASTVRSAVSGLNQAFLGPAAQMESVNQAFEVMIGDSREASTYVEELTQYASKTPFKFEDITEAAKTLLVMGTSSEKSVKVLRQLGDVASASGKSLGDLAAVYAKAQNIGLTSEVVEQFELQGVAVRRLIAEMRGISTQDVFEGISKKQYETGDIDAVLGQLTGPGGMYEGMTAKQGENFNGLSSMLGDNVNLVMMKIGEGLNEALKPAMAEAIELMQSFLPVAQEIGVEMAKALKPVAQTALEIGKGFMQHADTIKSFIGVVGELAQVFHDSKSALVGLFATMTLMKNGFAKDWPNFCGSMSGSWKAMCTSMRGAWKGAVISMKASLISTGIGALIWGLGEAVGWLYEKLTAVSEEAVEQADLALLATQEAIALDTKDEDERVAPVTKERQELEQRLNKAVGLEEVQQGRLEIEAKMEELKKRLEGEMPATEKGKLQSELDSYQRMYVNILGGIYDAVALQHEREQEAARAAAERAKAEQEAAENRKAFNKKRAVWEQKEYDARLKEMDLPARRAELERSAESFGITLPEGQSGGEAADGAIWQAMKERASRGKSVEALEKLREHLRELESAEKAEAKMTEEHERRISLLRAEIAGDDQKITYLKRQQEILELTAKFRKAGMTEDKAGLAARQEVDLSDAAQRKQTARDHEKRMELLRAEAQGDEKKILAVKQRQEMEALIAQYRKGGMSDKEARKAAVEEVSLKVVKEERETSWNDSMQRTNSVPRLIAQSSVSVGNGGASINLGRETVNYAKQQVNWLGKIHDTAERLEFLLMKSRGAVLGD